MSVIRGRVYVVGDNIDTDQIIPAEYLNLVPTIPEEYRKLGSYAMAGMPLAADQPPFVPPGAMETPYRIVIGGKNFGCGSSREHAPIARRGRREGRVAESYARIFFRNCVATGELYPIETDARLLSAFRTNDEAVLDLDAATITNTESGAARARPLGDAGPVIAAGGLFAYARQTGMIGSPSASGGGAEPAPSAGPDD
jgi:3-isopropylmalate/(R)-2-methylmalate dehydratase small subunit